MSKNVELLKGIFGDQVTELTEQQTSVISEKLDKLIEMRVEGKVRFQTEIVEAEAKEKYNTLLKEATTKYAKTINVVESKTVEAAKAYKVKMEKQVKQLSEQLKRKKDADIAAFKKTITEKLDKYLELELDKKIPDTYVEAVAQVSVLSPIVNGFKKIMEENYLKFDEENFGLLKDAKAEIMKLREEHAAVVNESMETNSELKNLKRFLKISEVCEGLTDSQRERASKLLESYDVNEIPDRYNAIRDLIIEGFGDVNKGKKVVAKEEDKIGKQSCAKSGKVAPPAKVNVEEAEEEEGSEADKAEDKKEKAAKDAKKPQITTESAQINEWAQLFRKQAGLRK